MTKEDFLSHLTEALPGEQVIVFDSTGQVMSLTQWQEWFFGTAKKDEITQNFNVSEAVFQRDIRMYGRVYICAELIVALQQMRNELKTSITITAFNRNETRQEQLKKSGTHLAASTSPHVYFLAADIVPLSVANAKGENKRLAIRQAGATTANVIKREGGRQVGPGRYMKNNQHFIHIDMTPLYFGKGKLINLGEYPQVWEKSAFYD